jgi:hypothetical protein
MLITLVVAEMCTALALFGCALLLLGHRPHYAAPSFSQIAIIALIIAIYAANYYALLSENRWIRFRAEFESYSKNSRIGGCACVVGMVLGSIVVMLVVMTAVRRLPY